MNLKSTRLILFTFLSAVYLPLEGQFDISRFTKYNTLDGLNHNHITCITQDSLGYIWIGTENGPMRFDGIEFTSLISLIPAYRDVEPFTVKISTLGKDELGISSLFGAFVINIHDYEMSSLNFDVEADLSTWAYNTFDVNRDNAGNYGVSTKTGFYIFDSHKQLLTSKHVFTSKDIGTSWMLYGREIALTPKGHMLQKNDRGFNVFDTEQKAILENPPLYELDKGINQEDDELHFAFLDTTTLIYYSPLQGKIFLHDLTRSSVKEFALPIQMTRNLNWFSRIVMYNDSTLLMNGKTGLYSLPYSASEKSVVIDPTLYLPTVEISALYVDRQKRLWIGTYAGLYKENSASPVERFTLSIPGKEESVHIKWMEKGKGVWYASTQHDGMLVLDESFKTLRQYPVIDHGEKLRVGKMLRYDSTYLWACTEHGILEFNTSTGAYTFLRFHDHPDYLNGSTIYELYRDRDGLIWVAGEEGNTVYTIEPKTKAIRKIEYSETNSKFTVNIVYRFGEDGHGNMWLCGDVMARYNPRLGKVDSLIVKLPLQHNSRKVFLLYRNSNNELWIAANGENWHIYSDRNGFSIFDDDRLSPDLNKYHVMIDDRLYYVSRLGKIVSLNTLNRKSRVLSAADGWDQEVLGSIGFFKDPDAGSIVFAGDNVVYRFKPEPDEQVAIQAPVISEINVFGKRTLHHPEGKLQFDSDEHTLEIKFHTLNFRDPNNQLYAYRLRGKNESDWITIDRPEIIFTQVPSGHYTLELRVSSKNNDWPEVIQSYPLMVRFPFYWQPWFIALVFGTLTCLIWLIVRYRLKQMKFISGLDKQVIEYELKALHAQMNPHFVFNCLNSIKEMIMSKDNRNANIYLNKFSFLLRSTLDQSKLSFVPLSHTIEYLQNYLEMEKLRFNHFNYSIEVQEGLETDTIMMAPLLLQPIVENAIWHGQDREKENNQLLIRFFAADEDLVCEVEDFGVGIHATKNASSNGAHLSTALDNIRKRIELLNRKHDVDYRLVIEDKSDKHQGQGTIVRMMFKHKQYEFD